MKFYCSIFVLIVMMLTGCAKQGMPPGGPEDKAPPEVVGTVPLPLALNVDISTPVEIHFSETIQAKNIKESVFITPHPGDRLKVKIKGRKVVVEPGTDLLPGKTYVVTVGTSVADLRNNALAASYTLAFSTGSRIDMGSIEGRVYGEKNASGIGVWAYDLNREADPETDEPDYIVQCGGDGSFLFSHLSAARYRLYAVQDRLADRLYNPVEDRVGLTSGDADLRDSSFQAVSGFRFQMTREDTLPMRLVRAEVIAPNWLGLRFDEAVALPDPLSESAVRVYADTLGRRAVPVHALLAAPDDENMLLLRSDIFPADSLFMVQTPGLMSLRGQNIDSSGAVQHFSSRGPADSTAPSIKTVDPAPASVNLSLDRAFTLTFAEPMDTSFNRDAWVLTDTSGQAFPAAHEWNTPLQIRLQPLEPLPGETIVQWNLAGAFRDEAGNGLADSLLTWTTVNPDTLSELGGVLQDADSSGMGTLHLSAVSVSTPGLSYTQWLPGPGPFVFKDILPGVYQLQCYNDRDGNRRYSHGRVKPFVPAERFLMQPDSIKVRSRWPNHGNELILK